MDPSPDPAALTPPPTPPRSPWRAATPAPCRIEQAPPAGATRDDSENTYHQLRVSEARFRGAFDAAPIGMAIVGLDARWLQVNASFCRMLGYTREEMLGKSWPEITHPDDRTLGVELVSKLIAGEIDHFTHAKRYIHKDGRVVRANLSVTLIRDTDGSPLYCLGQMQDVTDAWRRETFDADQRAVLELIALDRPLDEALVRLCEGIQRQLDGGWASMLVLDDGQIRQIATEMPARLKDAIDSRVYTLTADLAQREANPGQRLGVTFAGSDPVWRSVRDALTAEAVRTCWTLTLEGSERTPIGAIAVYCRHDRPPSTAECTMLGNAARLAALAIEHAQTARQLAHLVRHDALTGLANRLCLEDRIDLALRSARRNGTKVGLIAIDVDHFKDVNDRLGHGAGDLVLQQLSQRMLEQLRATSTLARVGGDEFMLLLPDLESASVMGLVARRLLAAVERPFTIDGRDLPVTLSIGIAVCPENGADSTTLQKFADEQLYLAKARGRNGFAGTCAA